MSESDAGGDMRRTHPVPHINLLQAPQISQDRKAEILIDQEVSWGLPLVFDLVGQV